MPRKQLRPPIKLRKLFAPLISLCRDKILTAPSQTSGTGIGDAAITVVLKFSVQDGSIVYPAKDFPHGQTLSRSDSEAVVKYDVKKLLSWFKERAYCSYDAGDLFRMRLPVLMMLAKNELKLDRMLDAVEFEQQDFYEALDTE